MVSFGVAWLGLMSVAAYFRRQHRSRRAQEPKVVRVRVVASRHLPRVAGISGRHGSGPAFGPQRHLSRPTTARAAVRGARVGERPASLPREPRVRSVASTPHDAQTPIHKSVSRARAPISAKLRFSVLMRDGFRCRYCGRTASEPEVVLHVDHVDAQLRRHVAVLLSTPLQEYTSARMTYDLGRLVGHGLIERIAKSHRYRLTPEACADASSSPSSPTASSIPAWRAVDHPSLPALTGQVSTDRSPPFSVKPTSPPDPKLRSDGHIKVQQAGLGEIDTPTLVTSGRYDEATEVIAGTVHDGIRGSEWVVFEESSHFAHAEEPERYLQVLGEFLVRYDQ